MPAITRLLKSYGLRVVAIVYFVVLASLIYLLFLGAAFNPENIEKFGDWYYLLAFLGLFCVPLLIEEIAGKEAHLAKLEDSGVDWFYRCTLGITAFCAFLWFINADNPRLEPLTIILGLISAWITHRRNLRQQKRTQATP